MVPCSTGWRVTSTPCTCTSIMRYCSQEPATPSLAVKAVLIDRGTAQKNAAAAALAAENGIDHLIWQEPDHEGFLLRHLPGCAQHRPPPGASLAALRQHWPDYDKARSAQQLAVRLNIERVRAACAVEPELRSFLRALGMLT